MSAARAERRKVAREAAREGAKLAHGQPFPASGSVSPSQAGATVGGFAARRAARERAEARSAMARVRAREDRIAGLEAQVPGWPELRSKCKREGMPYDDYAALLETYVGVTAVADAIRAAFASTGAA